MIDIYNIYIRNNRNGGMEILRSTTNLRKTNRKSISLSTQVPREIMKALEVEEGDKMDWVIEAVESSIIVRVEKSK